MQKLLLFTITLLFFISCGNKSSEEKKEELGELAQMQESEPEEVTPPVETPNAIVEENSYYGRSLKNAIGFVSVDMDRATSNGDELVTILNDDESIWFETSASNLNSEIETFAHHTDFQPWLVLFEVYHKVDFKCVSQDEHYFHVVVNDKENTVKRLKKGDNTIFMTVEEYFQTMLVDSSDYETNPMREGPGEDYPKANFSQADLIECMDAMNGQEVSGDWMKIEDIGNKNITGWIRWRKDDTLFLSLWYIL